MERSGLTFDFFVGSGVKSPCKKSLFLSKFCLTKKDILVSVFLTLFTGLFAPTSRSQMSKFLEFSESFGKSNGKKWSQI